MHLTDEQIKKAAAWLKSWAEHEDPEDAGSKLTEFTLKLKPDGVAEAVSTYTEVPPPTQTVNSQYDVDGSFIRATEERP